MTSLNTRLRGLAATLALLAFVVGVPSVLVAIDAVPDLEAFSWSRMTAPDNGTVLLEVLAIVCWVAWAIFTCQLMTSAFVQIRGLRSPRLPGLAVPQLAADRLVAVAALLFIAAPSASALVPEPGAAVAVAATPLPDSETAVVATSEAVPASLPSADQVPEVGIERYTVKRGDSLWRIAEERLGDGARYVELIELNRTVLDGRPDFLIPGTVLEVPKIEASPSDAYVVQAGDTLSEIAQEELGDADAYPSIVEASRDTIQADGAQLTDPDHIRPGWKVTIPQQGAPPERTVPHDVERPPSNEPAPPSPADNEPPAPTPTVAPPAPTDQSTAEHSDDTDGVVIPGWLLSGLAGAGSIFGGALWLVLRAQRRTQLRHRRPGRIFPPPPTELLPAAKTAHATASVIAPRIEALDAALRHLMPLPRIVTVTMSRNEISVSLAAPADLPRPWAGSGTEWRIAMNEVPERPEDSFPPYPLLVSVGQDVDGAFVFLNLEELRTVSVAGDADRKAAFARHLAAELAVNPWSIVTTVDLLGLGPDLSLFNLGRVRTHPEGDTTFIAELANTLSTITEPSDPDDFHVAIIATANPPFSDLDELAAVINGIPGRSSAALVDLEGEVRASGTHILHLTADGRLHAEGLGIDVTAAGLSEEEARACALLLDLTLTQEVVPVPMDDTDDAVSDLSGALAPNLTEPRPHGPAGSESLLPLDADAYTDAAATTVEDIEALAPVALPTAPGAVEAADPTLDDDLALWEAPGLVAAKLILLGPVSARTAGDTKATVHRRPFYIELLAFLALHPRGVSAQSIAEAFTIRPERVRVDISHLRRWLGTNPHTGQPYLPNAEISHDPDSPALYKLDAVLCDLDLFRRLRTRGQSRGADGIEDLVAALGLVSGEPFTELRQEHWNWLLEGDRWDHLMTSAIVDVGHVVTAHALATGDHNLALWAAQVSYAAAPYDEIAQLDMIQAERSTGDDGGADRDLDARIFNRRDDALPPIDLPQRTHQVVGEKKWAFRGRPRP